MCVLNESFECDASRSEFSSLLVLFYTSSKAVMLRSAYDVHL